MFYVSGWEQSKSLYKGTIYFAHISAVSYTRRRSDYSEMEVVGLSAGCCFVWRKAAKGAKK